MNIGYNSRILANGESFIFTGYEEHILLIKVNHNKGGIYQSSTNGVITEIGKPIGGITPVARGLRNDTGSTVTITFLLF